MAALVCAAGLALAPDAAHAYPTSVIYAPSGEALPFGSFALGAYSGWALNPKSTFSSGWGGFDVGVLPSVDLVSTPVGKLSFAGAEVGFDVFAPDADGAATLVLNAKLQLIKEATYWPAFSIGIFQASPDQNRGAMLGYLAFSKSFSVGTTELGQLTLGLMTSFADGAYIAPHCFVSGAPSCVFRGAAPFEDQNGALLAGYLSPWFGPFGFSIDHLGGTSAVSSTNFALNVRFWQDDAGGFALAGLGAFVSNDRRDTPAGPGISDGMFVQMAFISSLAGLFGWDPTKEWSRDPKKPRSRRGRRDIEDLLEAPTLAPPEPTKPEPTETTPSEPAQPAAPAP